MNDCAAILQIRGLSKQYVSRDALMRRRAGVTALQDVSLEVETGESVAVIGESGSGKSTLARCIVRMEEADIGKILFRGTDLAKLTMSELRPFRSQVQLIVQDSAGSLNPRFTAAEIIEEPLVIQGIGTGGERRAQVLELIGRVGLGGDWAERRVTQFSGGQRQRLAIARALVLRPALLILDEALTGLDLSTQAQVLNLLLELKDSYALTYLFISHDLGLVSRVADRIAVMHGGRIVECGKPQDILQRPQHPQTIALVNSALTMRRDMNAQAAAGGR
jgi:ABC-type glutathione transport system ATPase component